MKTVKDCQSREDVRTGALVILFPLEQGRDIRGDCQ